MWRRLLTPSTNSTRHFSTGVADDEFRVLDIVKSRGFKRQMRKQRERQPVAPPRYLKMDVNQDWPSVWPVARTFNPSVVPLPLHQGYTPTHVAPPGKFGNLELMKIHNFLHLTPPAIARHCEALKRFCTPWPKELEKSDDALPLEVIYSDYCHSSPTIRDFRARIVTIRLKLSKLNLDEKSRDKFLRLIGENYDIQSDTVTIATERCPLRKQNLEYAKYLLTALYHESKTRHDWEKEKSEQDMEKYVWENSKSFESLQKLSQVDKEASVEYAKSVTKLHNEGEDKISISDYGNSVRRMLKLPM